MKILSKSCISAITLVVCSTLISSCNKPAKNNVQVPKIVKIAADTNAKYSLIEDYKNRLDIYYPVTLSADISHLSDNQKQMLAVLIEASVIMDNLFWRQAFGDNKDTFLADITDTKTRNFANINYGPWDRLDGDQVFFIEYR